MRYIFFVFIVSSFGCIASSSEIFNSDYKNWEKKSDFVGFIRPVSGSFRDGDWSVDVDVLHSVTERRAGKGLINIQGSRLENMNFPSRLGGAYLVFLENRSGKFVPLHYVGGTIELLSILSDRSDVDLHLKSLGLSKSDTVVVGDRTYYPSICSYKGVPVCKRFLDVLVSIVK